MAAAHLDLQHVGEALQVLATKLERINASLGVRHDPFSEQLVENMVAGYAMVDELVRGDVDIFAMGQHRHMLELNRLALCGSERKGEYAAHVEATERRFYEERYGGVEDLVEWYRLHQDRPVWERAAGVYIRVTSAPQLFIEGNQRTGALLISYMSMRSGQGPFVLTVDNALDYFRMSATIREIRKNSFTALLRFPGIQRRLSRFLRREASDRFIAAENCAGEPHRASSVVH